MILMDEAKQPIEGIRVLIKKRIRVLITARGWGTRWLSDLWLSDLCVERSAVE
jgi:hypothetical protein